MLLFPPGYYCCWSAIIFYTVGFEERNHKGEKLSYFSERKKNQRWELFYSVAQLPTCELLLSVIQ